MKVSWPIGWCHSTRTRVRPIGIGEVFRRIVGKAVAKALKNDIRQAAGGLQVCAGLEGGAEAAIHAIREVFEGDDCEAVLLIDATNAFNLLNRKAALQNIKARCPRLVQYLSNTYRVPARLFVGDTEIASAEGTTQGDPLGTAMYAIATTPLIRALSGAEHPSFRGPTAEYPPLPPLQAASGLTVISPALRLSLPGDDDDMVPSHQAWLADDGTIAGKLRRLRAQWDILRELGPDIGYHPNAKKSVLVVKPQFMEKARELFKDTGVQITSEGQRHLGAAVGSPTFVAEYIREKVLSWEKQLHLMGEAGKISPHCLHAAFTKGFRSVWTYLLRTVPEAGHHMGPIDKLINEVIAPVVTQEGCSRDEHLMEALRLPCRRGGLGLESPSTHAKQQFEDSLRAVRPLIDSIKEQKFELDPHIRTEMTRTRAVLTKEKVKRRNQKYERFLFSDAPDSLRRSVQVAAEAQYRQRCSPPYPWLTMDSTWRSEIGRTLLPPGTASRSRTYPPSVDVARGSLLGTLFSARPVGS